MSRKLTVHTAVSLEDIQWEVVLSLLSKRGKLSFFEADGLIRRFYRRVLTIFHLSWFIPGPINAKDNQVVIALCEYLSADIVTLIVRRSIGIGQFRLHYYQALEFEPSLKREEREGECMPHLELSFMGYKLMFDSLPRVLLFQLLCTLIAVGFYVLVAGLLLYGSAVFVLFLERPYDLTRVATQKGTIFVALLGVLVALAAIGGRAVTNLMRLAFRKQ